ncbi:Uncharacterized protein APZ42_013511 [Daphnia magna]|uniref:Uncharacterized protein n=1 Tax=Daphnia magna TaxID=35525 RepID=A0A162QT47_9CRUS|nr:Uncharacterized protein APZ42_013511 [Daphnia magna]
MENRRQSVTHEAVLQPAHVLEHLGLLSRESEINNFPLRRNLRRTRHSDKAHLISSLLV